MCFKIEDATLIRGGVQSCTKRQAADRTTVDPFFRNSSLAEQSNKQLRLKTCWHMNQFTLIWRIRWMLYGSINKGGLGAWRRR
jgi:hypothetical protein